jgi:preprotein translocase subunit SecD
MPARMRAAPLFLLALAALAASAAAPPPRPGLWIGPIHACRSTVAEVVVAENEVDGLPNAVIRFRPDAAEALHRVTAARVGEAMPVRLDGRVILAPIVREPITGGEVQITPIAADEAEAIRAAALGAC